MSAKIQSNVEPPQIFTPSALASLSSGGGQVQEITGDTRVLNNTIFGLVMQIRYF
jgi:hypothetical protein